MKCSKWVNKVLAWQYFYFIIVIVIGRLSSSGKSRDELGSVARPRGGAPSIRLGQPYFATVADDVSVVSEKDRMVEIMSLISSLSIFLMARFKVEGFRPET